MIFDLFKKSKDESLDAASREVLDQALGQRSKMDVEFEQEATSLSGLTCAINTIGKDILYLDVYGLDKPGSFTGKYFSCYFRIREGKAGVGFYGFRTRVREVRTAKNGGIVFVVSLPAKVERSQRRHSMRVRPMLGWFEEILLWGGAQKSNPAKDDILVGFRELRQGKLCRLENISAGGIGLYFARQFCLHAKFCPSASDHYTLYLRFAQEVRNQPRELWLSGRTARLLEDRVTKDLDLGLEFTHVGRLTPDAGEMQWLAIQDYVAEELMTRVFEWHAALARERVGAS